jgi:fatty-acyl-CoA synthase
MGARAAYTYWIAIIAHPKSEIQTMPANNRPSAENPERRLATNAWIRALENTKVLNDDGTRPLCAMLDDLAASHGDAIALLGENEALSYRELAARANRYAHWAIARGFARGEVICLLMPNCPEYAAVWLGLNRAGCAVALLNTNLSGEALLHSIRAAGSRRVIAGESLLPAIVDVADQLPPDVGIWVSGTVTHGDWPAIGPELAVHAGTPVSYTEREPPGLSERSLLIYTSGTTGLPKAANVTHSRVLEWSLWFAGMMDTQREDRLYNCLPMYHSTGGVVAIGAMLVKGGSVLIRARFSASRFWDDVVDGGCTIFLYIGELCRYLVTGPPRSNERIHQLRLACGNGLQGDVWQAFQERFGVPRILEFYASTEGNVSLYNCEGRRGAIGRVPPFLAHRFPIALIRLDVETDAPMRDQNGFCIRCDPNEPGEAIGRVADHAGSPMHQFDGYTNAEASAARLLHGVFATGDRWYRTGDLMRKDAAGYYYFVDRIGDTFRWKGENVSTTEVAMAIRSCPGVIETVVFGVRIPGHEGRAGMAAITTDARFDLATLRNHLAAALPAYARPLFVRCCRTLDVTGTFKLVKSKLIAEGYADAGDPVWFNDHAAGRFVACEAALCRSIEANRTPL